MLGRRLGVCSTKLESAGETVDQDAWAKGGAPEQDVLPPTASQVSRTQRPCSLSRAFTRLIYPRGAPGERHPEPLPGEHVTQFM